MPNVCKICNHEQRADIERLIHANASKRAIARQFEGISDSAVWRHKACIYDEIKRLQEVEAITRVRTLQEETDDLRNSLWECFREQRGDTGKKRNLFVMMSLSAELRKLIELKAKFTGELDASKRDQQEEARALARFVRAVDLLFAEWQQQKVPGTRREAALRLISIEPEQARFLDAIPKEG